MDTIQDNILKEKIAKLETELAVKNRELEIEASLERVRSAAMMMRSSSELNNVIFRMHVELTKLDAQLERCFIMVVNPENLGITWWMAGKEGLLNDNGFFVQNNSHPSHQMYLDHWRGKHKKWQYLFEGKEKKEWDLFGFGETELSKLPEPIKEDMSAVKKINLSGSSENFGCLVTGSVEPLADEYQDILMRFTIVFDQTYTRFLDLQKAESQAREAQIEAALERVRSRSMAMHKSDELKEVIIVVLEQFIHLKIKAQHAGFYIDYKAQDDMHIWLADPNLEPFFAVLPYFDTPTWNSFREAKAKGTTFHTDLLDFEEKNKFYNSLFKLFPVPEEAKQFYLQCKGLAVSTVLLDNVGLYIENFEGIPYSDEENKVLMRFGKVFQQTYTRFLDLQKAEVQAREAQIEAALERVRSRTMAMHTSAELIETAELLFDQLKQLGAELQGVAFAICNRDSQTVQKWTSIGVFTHPYNIEPGEQRMYEAWKNGEEYYEEVYEGERQEKYYEVFMQIPEFKQGLQKFIDSGYPIPKWQKNHAVTFKYGYLLFITTKPFKETGIFLRFGKVFEQTYTRFLDLKKAEAQAEKAEHDMIEIKSARKKAEDALHQLQQTQKQLIQSEKMASLGELTAGIAHEIQNPLNFVNNFSEVNKEMLEELKAERLKPNADRALEDEMINDIIANEEKINHHGKRADAIVKGMLQHSRKSSGQKEPTDINALCDEYLRLSYHGFRAKDKSFNATINTEFDNSIGKINIIPQDIGRVLLNLFNNAFYACAERSRSAVNEQKIRNLISYEPTVSVTTRKIDNRVEINVSDNGGGIAEKIKEKIFQPFFTTKPTGQGTGLGLSLSYDIIEAHGGQIKLKTEEGEGSDFILELPV